jgi:hypothetical protein
MVHSDRLATAPQAQYPSRITLSGACATGQKYLKKPSHCSITTYIYLTSPPPYTKNLDIEIHAHEMHAYKMHVYEIHAYEMHAHEMHAHEMHAYKVHTQ